MDSCWKKGKFKKYFVTNTHTWDIGLAKRKFVGNSDDVAEAQLNTL